MADRDEDEGWAARTLRVALGHARARDLLGMITTPEGGTGPEQEPAGPAAVLVQELLKHDLAGRLRWCRHLPHDGSEPALWLAWHALRLYCPECVKDLPPIVGADNHRCDWCGYVDVFSQVASGVLRARELQPRPGCDTEYRPSLVIRMLLCRRCSGIGPGMELPPRAQSQS